MSYVRRPRQGLDFLFLKSFIYTRAPPLTCVQSRRGKTRRQEGNVERKQEMYFLEGLTKPSPVQEKTTTIYSFQPAPSPSISRSVQIPRDTEQSISNHTTQRIPLNIKFTRLYQRQRSSLDMKVGSDIMLVSTYTNMMYGGRGDKGPRSTQSRLYNSRQLLNSVHSDIELCGLGGVQMHRLSTCSVPPPLEHTLELQFNVITAREIKKKFPKTSKRLA